MLGDILHYIKNTLQQEITLENMAAQARISPSYLCRIFKQKYQVFTIAVISVQFLKNTNLRHPRNSVIYTGVNRGQ